MEDWGAFAMAVDWVSHAKHRRQVAEDSGLYVGLLDENGEPLMDCPPVVSLSAPQTRNASTSLRMQLAVKSPAGVVHPVCDELLAEGITDAGNQWVNLDSEGRVLAAALDATRFVLLEWPGGVRRVYRVTHTVAEGGLDTPSTIEVNGVDLLKMLSLIPGFSAPLTVSGEWKTFTRDWAGPENTGVTFSKPRDLQDMKMVTVADGVTIEGDAESVIRRLVSESLAAAWKAIGPEVVADPPMVVDPAGSGLASPHLLLRPTDRPLLEEVAGQAATAGVSITADMWLPGDSPVSGLSLAKPTVVVRILQTVEVDD